MISDEAAESGARVLIEDGKFGIPWEDASEDDRAEVMARVRAILEAAAPRILADYLLTIAADARARGDVGKEEEGGIEAWTYLEWKAEQIRPAP